MLCVFVIASICIQYGKNIFYYKNEGKKEVVVMAKNYRHTQ